MSTINPAAPRATSWLSRGVEALRVALAGDRFLLLMVICALFKLGVDGQVRDPDLGWHLRSGEMAWRTGRPPVADPFSYTHPGSPWIAYSWLAELAMWLVTTHLGFHVLRILVAAFFTATFIIVFRTCRATAGPASAAAATVLAALATLPFVTERPALVSLVLLAVWANMLARYRRGEPVRTWMLLPLTVLWANVHVFFVVGIGWLWALVAWTLIGRWLAGEHWRQLVRTPLLHVAIACSLATMLTPYGPALLRHVVEIGRQPATLPEITEHTSPDFHGYAGALVLPFVLALMASLAVLGRRSDPFLLTLVLAHTGLALYMQRNIPSLAILAAPLIARGAASVLPDSGRLSEALSGRRLAARATLSLIPLGLVISALPRDAALEPNLRPKMYPVAASHYLEQQPPLGRMLNSYTWGGFLIYALYPRYKVSIDGRSGVYGEAETRAYLDTHLARENWRAYFDRVNPDFVLWERGGVLATVLAESPRWVRIYADDTAVIFLRADHPLRAQLTRHHLAPDRGGDDVNP